MSEIERIKENYRNRPTATNSQDFSFIQHCRNEREFYAHLWLAKYLTEPAKARALEIGAGFGDNTLMLKRVGFDWKNIFVNELLPERLEYLQRSFSKEQILPGDIREHQLQENFDLVLQFTVFTSLLSAQLKQEVAQKIIQALKPNGLLLWYDFAYNNPNNKNVKGVQLDEIAKLFPNFTWLEKKWVTLAPPIGRQVGNLYGLFNGLFPFLRTHRLCLLQKSH